MTDTPPEDAQPVEPLTAGPTFAEMLLTAHYRHTDECPGEPCMCHYYEDLTVIRRTLVAARAGDGLLREALEIIAAPPTDAPDGIGVKARNIARAALAVEGSER